jgi:hypothetical protein
MKIAINTDTRQVVTWAGEPVAGLAMTRRDKFPVEVKFISGATYVALPSGASLKLGLKAAGDFGGNTRAGSVQWVESGAGRTAVYTFFLNLDTVEMNALFAAEPESVAMALEVEWSYDTMRLTVVPVPVAMANDYIREEDTTPVGAPDGKATEEQARAGVDNTTWMTPLRVAQAIGGLTTEARPADTRYGPHASLEAALEAVPESMRYSGLTLGVQEDGRVVEYWFPGAVEDGDLELKTVFDAGTY